MNAVLFSKRTWHERICLNTLEGDRKAVGCSSLPPLGDGRRREGSESSCWLLLGDIAVSALVSLQWLCSGSAGQSNTKPLDALAHFKVRADPGTEARTFRVLFS